MTRGPVSLLNVHGPRQNDVRALYKAVLLDPAVASASHAMAAYRLEPSTGFVDRYNDDGDFGLGRAARHCLTNTNTFEVAVYIYENYVFLVFFFFLGAGTKVSPRVRTDVSAVER